MSTQLVRSLAIAFCVCAIVVSACGGGAAPAGTSGSGVVVLTPWEGAERDAFQRVLDAFRQKSGISASQESVRADYASVLTTRVTSGTAPDVAVLPGVGTLRRLARDGSSRKIRDIGIDPGALETSYLPGAAEVGKVDGELYALPITCDSKGTVWYRPDRFQKLGVRPAQTWDDFTRLLANIKSKGDMPLALGAKDARTLTDWFESIYVRQAGAAAYSRLFSEDGDWNDGSVTDAIEAMTSALKSEYVVGGISAAVGSGSVDAIAQVFSATPKAAIYYEGSAVAGVAAGQVNRNLKVGQQIDFFEFPTFGAGGNPVTVTGQLIGAFSARPGVRELMQFLATTEAGEAWARAGGSGLSCLKDVPASAYADDLTRKEAEQLAKSDAVRFDGSELLPPDAPDLGVVLQGALRGQDVEPALQQFQEQVRAAWDLE